MTYTPADALDALVFRAVVHLITTTAGATDLQHCSLARAHAAIAILQRGPLRSARSPASRTVA